MGDHSDIDHTGLTGVGGSMTVENEGTPLATGATTLDFVGAGVTASGTGAEKTITIPGGSGIIAYDLERYTGGDIALTSTSQAAVTGPGDLVVAASTGDLLMIGLSASPVTNTAQSIGFEFATIVSAAPVNYVGARSGTPINIPVQMWFIAVSESNGIGGEFPYVVQAGDISGGNVTLRLYARVSGNRSVNADAANPLDIWVRNVGQ